MRKSARPAEMQTHLENDAHKEPNAKKIRFNDKIAKIATMDNGTMVEAFKYLDYCHLAKKSLVSKRFRNVIQTNRYSLPRLFVHNIHMGSANRSERHIKIFNEELSAEAYDAWVVDNHYSKQIPLESQIVEKEITHSDRNVYMLHANAVNTGDELFVFAEINDENWPLFHHFVRLLSDPFIYIEAMKLVPQNDILKFLIEAIHPDSGRIRCQDLDVELYFNTQKFINWIKDHVRCDELYICGDFTSTDSNQELLNLFVTGAHCSSTINVKDYDLDDVIVDFVKKFLDLKNCDEYQLVQSIESEMYYVVFNFCRLAHILKREYPGFLVKEEHDEDYDSSMYDEHNEEEHDDDDDSSTYDERNEKDDSQTYVFVFNNGDIGKKLQLTIMFNRDDEYSFRSDISLNIEDL